MRSVRITFSDKRAFKAQTNPEEKDYEQSLLGRLFEIIERVQSTDHRTLIDDICFIREQNDHSQQAKRSKVDPVD